MSEEISFGSDNHYGVHPDVMAAIVRANSGAAHAYGEDAYTERAVEKMRAVFGSQADIFFVFNGTAANVLSIQTLARPHQAVLCTTCAHINTDECGAPEAMTGCKLISFPHQDGKWNSQSLEQAERVILDNLAMAPHRTEPKIISLTQTTEFGTVYSIDEIRTICAFARQHKLYVHMDGARIANAAAALGVSLKEMTEGVDVVSFGGTKNGLMCAEAVVFLRPGLGQAFPYLRKQAMQLPSKMRFLSAQFDALFTDDLWLRNAQHANQMARLLEKALRPISGIKITRPVEANAVFAILPADVIPQLQKHTFFYEWDSSLHEVRLMASFHTTQTEIEGFAKELRRLVQPTS